jgi:hypothetical protein
MSEEKAKSSAELKIEFDKALAREVKELREEGA